MSTEPTLGDLVQALDGVRLVAGPADALVRTVAAAHVAEVDDPDEPPPVGALLLTSGPRLQGQADATRRLIATLHDVGAAALGLRLGPVFRTTPKHVRQAADDYGLPLLEIDIPLPRVIDEYHALRQAQEVSGFARMISLQRSLTDALLADDPIRSLIHRLSRLTGATAAMLHPDGQIEIASGTLPAVALREEIGNRSLHVELHVAGWHGIAAEVRSAGNNPSRWLLVAARRDQFPNALTNAAVHVAANVAAALGQVETLVRRQDRAIRSAVLDSALNLQPADDYLLVESRAAALDITFAEPARVVVLDQVSPPRPGPRADNWPWIDRLDKGLDTEGLAHLRTIRDGAAVLLVQGALERTLGLLRTLVAEEDGLLAGVGRPVEAVRDVPASFHDARLAVRHLRQSTAGTSLLSYDDFDLATILIADVGAERVTPWAADVLRPLDSKPILLEALRAYFTHDFDIMRAAKSMHVHHNTLRYRLGRVEAALGQSLRHPATIASLHLALMASPATRRRTRRDRPISPSPAAPRQGISALTATEDAASHPGFADLPATTGPGEPPS